MAVGSGLLIGSVAFELVDEALKTRTVAGVGLRPGRRGGLHVGDWLLSRGGGGDRKDSAGPSRTGHHWRSSGLGP
jgi:ZIP family zinc transporter